MLKKPDNKSLITLTMMFLIGIAMIFIPLIQQRQEIESDNSIYAMIAEEIRHQQEAEPVVTTEPEPEEEPPAEELPAEEPEATEVPSEEPLPEETEEPNPEETPEAEPDLPSMTVEEILPVEEAAQPAPTDHAVLPAASTSPSPTKKPAETATKPPATQNADYIAWLSIPGTVIDYPVVRSDRTDYYLHHLITGQESKLGTLFSLTTSDYETPSRNIAIYGHHLSNSTAMFSTLLEYKKEDYWKKHQLIQVDSIYGKKTYRIFAVLNHTVSDWDASTASFKDDASFLKFVNRARKKAFYDTGITVSETDNIITLITCDRSFGGVQGRLLVMGVEQ